jgi:hypothetical protein
MASRRRGFGCSADRRFIMASDLQADFASALPPIIGLNPMRRCGGRYRCGCLLVLSQEKMKEYD